MITSMTQQQQLSAALSNSRTFYFITFTRAVATVEAVAVVSSVFVQLKAKEAKICYKFPS